MGGRWLPDWKLGSDEYRELGVRPELAGVPSPDEGINVRWGERLIAPRVLDHGCLRVVSFFGLGDEGAILYRLDSS